MRFPAAGTAGPFEYALSVRLECRSRDIQSSGDLARLVGEVADVGPELFESAQYQSDAFQISVSDPGLAQHPDMRTMHVVQAIPKRAALIGQPNVDRAPVVRGSLMGEVSVLD